MKQNRFHYIILLLFIVLVLYCPFNAWMTPLRAASQPFNQPQNKDIATPGKEWFVFQPTNTLDAGIIGMADWLDAPAGKHGIVRIQNSGFVFEDGTPVKFWGVNHSNKGCGPLAAEADRRAAWYARMGVNAIRLHKFTYANTAFGDPHNSTRLTNEGWNRLDYYMHKLRQTGIYYGWSHIYGHRLVPGDSSRVLGFQDIRENLNGNTAYLVNFSPDLQDLLIDLTVHMLNHRNPHTGLRYADDPALAFVELQNEDNLFFAAAMSRIEKAPTYKKLLCQQFSDWLRRKYGDHQGLIAAWGQNSMDMFPDQMTGEHLDKKNIYPIAHHGYLSPEAINASSSPRRLLDTARFLYEVQRQFYDRYVRAIRATGYKGPLVGSCWQAGHGVPHYYNLHADFSTGIIDRHNYFAARPHSLQTGEFPNESMLSHAGSGLLSSGLQAVKGRPFVLSEWISKMPNEWIAEGPAIIGVYGMGLQGWDGSFHFNAGDAGFSSTLQNPNVYNSNLVTQIGLFPALARMIHRQDVAEGELLPNRKVHVGSLLEGKIGFEEKIRQQADIKELGGDVPIDALALGRLELEFTAGFQKTDLPDFTTLVNAKIVRSNTGQLRWDYRDKGYFTVNTASTKGFVGHDPGKAIQLDNITIEVETPFAVMLMTSLDKARDLSHCTSALITVLARARNSGMEITSGKGISVLENIGQAPLLLQAVRADLQWQTERAFRVIPLDHDGLATGRELPVSNNQFHLDTGKDRAVWYWVKFEN